ncbi:MAG: small-conductance mechanosensitive channel, partial [Actinobacteria bacterium]|nr:small-conductance mechanosensitive channel [Actinomycetota bacterium]
MNTQIKDIWAWFSGAPLHILAVLLIALIASRLGSRAITRAMNRIAEADFVPGPKRGTLRQKERAKTAGTVLRSAMNSTIWLISS